MGDGRTDLFRNMWTRTTTNDTLKTNIEEQYSRVGWEYPDTKVRNKKDLTYMPDQKLHRNVSFLKSAVRILGFGSCWWSLDIGITLLILAEVIGIGEELV